MTFDDFRRIALSLPGAEELTGLGYPNCDNVSATEAVAHRNVWPGAMSEDMYGKEVRARDGADSGPSRTVIPAHCGQRSGDRGQ
jgi:hypothetical protein